MTTVPHQGLRGGPVRRPRVAARLVRPSIASVRKADDRIATAMSSGTATVRSSAVGVSSLAGSIGARPVRLVLAGRRVRLGSSAFVLLVLGSLTLTLVSLLFLNTSLAEDSFRLQELKTHARDLTIREQTLSEQLAAAESPSGLEKKARTLGMVAAGTPVFLRLNDSKLLGDREPAEAPPAAAPAKPKPAATAAGQPGADSAAAGMAGGETPVELVPPAATGPGSGLSAGTSSGLTAESGSGAGGEQGIGIVGSPAVAASIEGERFAGESEIGQQP